MLRFEDVMDIRIDRLDDAVAEWQKMKSKYEGLADRMTAEVINPLKGEWEGDAATSAQAEITKAKRQLEAAAKESDSRYKLLKDAATEFRAVQKKLKKIVEEDAPSQKFKVTSTGQVIDSDPMADRIRHDDPDAYRNSYLPRREKELAALEKRIKEVLKEAAVSDSAAAWAIRQDSNGASDKSFNPAIYSSLEQAEEAEKSVREAIALTNKAGDLSESEILKLSKILDKHKADSVFSEKFATAVGASGLINFWAESSETGAENFGKERENSLKILQESLGSVLANATQSDSPAMNKWKEEIIGMGPKTVDVGKGHDPYGFQIMGGLLRHGSYDTDFLGDYGKALMDVERSLGENGPGVSAHWGNPGAPSRFNFAGKDYGNDPMTGFMEALGHNPEASTKFFDETFEDNPKKKNDVSNLDYLLGEREWPKDFQQGPQGPMKETDSSGYDSLGNALESATTGHPYDMAPSKELAPHSKEQAELMNKIVSSISEKPELMKEEMADSFGQISGEYMSDISRAMNVGESYEELLFPNAGVDAKLGESDTVRFLHQVAQHPDGYSAITLGQSGYTSSLVGYHMQNPEIYSDVISEGETDKGLTKAVQKISSTSGEIQGIAEAGRFYAVEKDAVENAGEFNDALGRAAGYAGGIASIGIGVGVASVTGPAGIVTGGVATAVTNDILSQIVDGVKKDDLGKEIGGKIYENAGNWEEMENSTGYALEESISKSAKLGESAVSEGLLREEVKTSVSAGYSESYTKIGRYVGGEIAQMLPEK